MLVRRIVVRSTPDQLWNALTEPDEIEAWFGSRVEWDLRPGGRARFFEGDGTVRGGVVDAVRPGHHLRFRWWPEDEAGSGPHRGASQVSYDLEPDEDGTRLTVTEQPVPAAVPATEASVRSPSASATTESWSAWDSRLFRCWAAAPAAGLAGIGLGVARCGR